jgi:hypothetical protein
LNDEVADFRRSGQSQGAGPGWRAARWFLLALVLRKLSLETDFLVPLELHHPAVMDDQLNGAIADRAERLPELLEQGLGSDR